MCVARSVQPGGALLNSAVGHRADLELRFVCSVAASLLSCLLSLSQSEHYRTDHSIFRGSRLLPIVIGSVGRQLTLLSAAWLEGTKLLNG